MHNLRHMLTILHLFITLRTYFCTHGTMQNFQGGLGSSKMHIHFTIQDLNNEISLLTSTLKKGSKSIADYFISPLVLWTHWLLLISHLMILNSFLFYWPPLDQTMTLTSLQSLPQLILSHLRICMTIFQFMSFVLSKLKFSIDLSFVCTNIATKGISFNSIYSVQPNQILLFCGIFFFFFQRVSIYGVRS